MQTLAIICVLSVGVRGGGGAAKTGIEQIWTDDYKIFEQVYGKTSDKDIYGEKLPPTIRYEPLKAEASEKKERYQLNYDKDLFNSADLGDRYNDFISKSKLKANPTTSSYSFINYTDFKSISQNNDSKTYNYLKHSTQENAGFLPTIGAFTPYSIYGGTNPKESDAYKSLQNLLNAHETKKRNTERDENYLTYGKEQRNKPSRIRGNDTPRLRCVTQKCRKRTSFLRYGPRPHVKKIKHRVVKY